jgi:nucleoside phosphorylase
METIGLIAAMTQESDALLRCIRKWERTELGPFRAVRFRLLDRDCLLVTTGMGLQRAADGTHALLAAITPHLLISFGIAGAVNDNLHIGDVVVAGSTWLLDMGLPGQPQPLASLSEAAWNAARAVVAALSQPSPAISL